MRHLMKQNSNKGYVSNLQEEMNRIIEDAFGTTPLSDWVSEAKQRLWRPPIELSETDKKYLLKIQLPGFEKKDIEVEVSDDSITIKAENTYQKETKDENLFRSEFRYGNFMRTIPFPSPILSGKTQAEYKNGVLSISADKVEKKEHTKKLHITE